MKEVKKTRDSKTQEKKSKRKYGKYVIKKKGPKKEGKERRKLSLPKTSEKEVLQYGKNGVTNWKIET